MYEYDYDNFYRQSNRFIRELEKAINGEFSAIHCYEQLSKMAPNETQRKQILDIREDEKKHYQQFVQIYYNITGSQPQPKITEECPSQYLEGLEYALKDEQETADFYLRISDETNISFVKELFRRIAADEQNHAVWFLYFYTKEKVK